MQLENVIEDASEKAVVRNEPAVRVHVWDLPIRIFHWSLMVAVLIAVITGLIGGSWMRVHAKAGLFIIWLIAFRLVWGFVGSTYARFLNFIPSLSKLKVYFAGQWKGVGHNPLSAFAVFALLGLLSLQAATGLFSNDDIDFTGPLHSLVDAALSKRLTGIHHLLSNFLLGMLALHVVTILFYAWFKKDNLIKPMVTGWKDVQSGRSAAKGSFIALIGAMLIALFVALAASGIAQQEPSSSTPSSRSPAW